MNSKSKIEIVCHKGANEYAPENTYAAAQLCLDWGMDYVEIDVNLSKDGIYYLFHGPELEKSSNGHGKFSQFTSSQIDALDAGSWFDPKFAGERIPRLEPFLRWIKGKAKLFIDVKAGEPQPLIDLIRAHGFENDCFFWCGNNDWARKFRQLAPNLALKINVKNVAGVIAAQQSYAANIVEVDPENMSQILLDECHKRGIKVMIYEKRKDPAAFRRVLEWGADLVNLDHGDLFAQVAKEYYAEHPSSIRRCASP